MNNIKKPEVRFAHNLSAGDIISIAGLVVLFTWGSEIATIFIWLAVWVLGIPFLLWGLFNGFGAIKCVNTPRYKYSVIRCPYKMGSKLPDYLLAAPSFLRKILPDWKWLTSILCWRMVFIHRRLIAGKPSLVLQNQGHMFDLLHDGNVVAKVKVRLSLEGFPELFALFEAGLRENYRSGYVVRHIQSVLPDLVSDWESFMQKHKDARIGLNSSGEVFPGLRYLVESLAWYAIVKPDNVHALVSPTNSTTWYPLILHNLRFGLGFDCVEVWTGDVNKSPSDKYGYSLIIN